jgi:hypothetical protein
MRATRIVLLQAPLFKSEPKSAGNPTMLYTITHDSKNPPTEISGMTKPEPEPAMPAAPLSDYATWGRYYYQLAAYRQAEIERLRTALEEIAISHMTDTSVAGEIARRALYGSADEPK